MSLQRSPNFNIFSSSLGEDGMIFGKMNSIYGNYINNLSVVKSFLDDNHIDTTVQMDLNSQSKESLSEEEKDWVVSWNVDE